MQELRFSALGTVWEILLDHSNFPKTHQQALAFLVTDFETKYSRFKKESLITKLNQSSKPFPLSSDLYQMLSLGKKLETLTKGHFSLNLHQLLSAYGYDQNYSFKKNEHLLSQDLGAFTISSETVIKTGNVQLDLGSLGKGYLIDLIAKQLESFGYKNFLIDGGGDIYVTSKRDGSSWTVALEHPLDQSLIIGRLPMKNQAIATSSSQKRKFKSYHHLLNPKTKKPVSSMLSSTVLASSAFIADACSTAIFVSPQVVWKNLSSEFDFEYLAIYPDLSFTHTKLFPKIF